VRLIAEIALNTLVYKDWLWFSARHEVESDSKPRPGIEEIDRNTNFSLKVQF